MARNRSKKVNKLRRYRDQLIGKIVGLEATVREQVATMLTIRKAIRNEDHLRALALTSEEWPPKELLNEFSHNELAKELTLVYRFLVVERRYTEEVSRAANARDYLRVAALCADHTAEVIAHEKMLSEWSKDHGFQRSLIKEIENEKVA